MRAVSGHVLDKGLNIAGVPRSTRTGRLRTGFALLKDRNVSLFSKAFALGLGAAATLVLLALEVPLEGVVGTVLPIFGIFADLALDGLEALILPVIFAALFLPSLASTRGATA
jgi:hypothetical protein